MMAAAPKPLPASVDNALDCLGLLLTQSDDQGEELAIRDDLEQGLLDCVGHCCCALREATATAGAVALDEEEGGASCSAAKHWAVCLRVALGISFQGASEVGSKSPHTAQHNNN